MKPKLFVFLGRSGCGKGTQTALLKEYLKKNTPDQDVFYVSTGDEFRKLISSGTYTANQVKKIIDGGNLVPSFLASMMWATMVARDYKENMHMIVDGSPRTLAEKEIFDTIFDFYGLPHVYEFSEINIVYMNVSEKWATERLLGRGRADDSTEAVSKRMAWFEKYLEPVIEEYRTQEKIKFHNINGEQTIEDVHQEIIKSLELRV